MTYRRDVKEESGDDQAYVATLISEKALIRFLKGVVRWPWEDFRDKQGS